MRQGTLRGVPAQFGFTEHCAYVADVQIANIEFLLRCIAAVVLQI